MFCKNCGTQNPDEAKICAQCGAELKAQPASQPVSQPVERPDGAVFKDFMVLNIIAVVVNFLCCGSAGLFTGFMAWLLTGLFHLGGLATGIVGIVMGSQAKNANNTGDFETADKKAKTAKIMAWISWACVALCVILVLLGVLLFGGVMGLGILSEM